MASVLLASMGLTPFGVKAQSLSTSPLAAAAVGVEVPSNASDSRLEWWQEARFGMFIHFGLYAIPAGKWGEATSHGEWIRDTARIPKDEYSKFVEQFNPVDFDAQAIVKAAKDAGMGYIVITSKHHDGFALFDSKASDFDVMATPFKRDIMKELSHAAKTQDVRMCWYYSIMDWYHPDYQPRRPWEPAVRAGDPENTPNSKPNSKPDFDRYTDFMKAQLRELLTAYGDIGILWFDGQWEHNWNNDRGRDLYKFVRGIQPNIIINSRVGREGGDFGLDRTSAGLGDYATPEQVIPDKAITHQPWETCMTMNRHWGFNAADQDFKSTSDLIRKLCDIAGKGGNFLLNVGPDARGRIPQASMERLADIGVWMKSHGESIRGTVAGPLASTPAWGAVTARPLPGGNGDTRLYVHIFNGPGEYLLPGLLNKVTRVQVMNGGATTASARTTASCEGVTVILDAMTNPHATVVMLDLEGEPDVAVPPTIEAYSDIFVDQVQVDLITSQRDVRIHYTTNGTEPNQYSPHEVPVVLKESATIVARPFANGKPAGPSSTRAFTKQVPSTATSNAAKQLQCEIFSGTFTSVMELDTAKPIHTKSVSSLDLTARPQDNNWGMRWRGVIEVPKRGVYRFHLGSDDGSMLWINQQVVVDNDKPHSFRFLQGDAALDAGPAEFELRFFENTGGFDLKLEWESPDAGLTRASVPVHSAK